MFSEISQRERERHRIIWFICGIYKKKKKASTVIISCDNRDESLENQFIDESLPQVVHLGVEKKCIMTMIDGIDHSGQEVGVEIR